MIKTSKKIENRMSISAEQLNQLHVHGLHSNLQRLVRSNFVNYYRVLKMNRILINLNPFFSNVQLWSSWKYKKAFGFLMFSLVSKQNIGRKGLMKVWSSYSYCEQFKWLFFLLVISRVRGISSNMFQHLMRYCFI